ncbi:5'-nucleotidase C-terminal domain-containing protein [Prevotella sp. HUN102]|uniref:5'-nucleotidase C-terminal domain-containing protein n=1 Tax=Prevotella sp. HUN102 TaxID=1392486 RepID=UPI000490E034|nr:5'-nucleotidase [Prevotella sp. HUN102]
MRKKVILCCGFSLVLLATGCKSNYGLSDISRTRILVDSRYDASVDAGAVAFMQPYKHEVDSIMGPIVGESDHYMVAKQPESDLSNLLADIMVWGARDYKENVDFGVYNMGGIRAALPKGKVTYGDVLEIAPFENKICFFTLSGSTVLQLFREIAHNGGEGVSKGVELLITSDGKLKSAKLHGKAIDPNGQYRVATLDYVAQGNDRMNAMKAKTNVNSPQDEKSNSRYIIINYFKENAAKGEVVNSVVEGRIRVE